MGTGQHHRIHSLGLQLIRIFFDGGSQFRTTELLSFDERDELGTALAEYLDLRIDFLDFPFMGSGSYRKIGGQEADFVVFRHAFHHMGAFFHTDDGKIVTVFDYVRPQHRNGIAGHHQLFDLPAVQPGRHFTDKCFDFFP